MRSLRIWLRDWWRGYTDNDLRVLRIKLVMAQQKPKSGLIIGMTPGEYAAFKRHAPRLVEQTTFEKTYCNY